MTDSKNRQWILNARPAGKLTGEEFLWNEAPIPRPSDGQVLIRTLWLSVDPAQRIWMARDSYKPAVPLGDVMQSFAVGQVSNRVILTSSRATSCEATSAGRTTS
jgi:NADPH-dependent curcumin reductase